MKLKSAFLVVVSIAIPGTGYVLLLNRRLEKRFPLIKREFLPSNLATAPTVGVHPKINYTEGYCVELNSTKKLRRNSQQPVDLVSNYFWNSVFIQAEGKLLSLFSKLGMDAWEKRNDTSSSSDKETTATSSFPKGKTLLNGVFQVEPQRLSYENLFSFWIKPTYANMLLGGIHAIAVEKIDEHSNRFWFISHTALNVPCNEIIADDSTRVTSSSKYVGSDPLLKNPVTGESVASSTSFRALLWFHRLYSRMLFDAAIRELNFKMK